MDALVEQELDMEELRVFAIEHLDEDFPLQGEANNMQSEIKTKAFAKLEQLLRPDGECLFHVPAAIVRHIEVLGYGQEWHDLWDRLNDTQWIIETFLELVRGDCDYFADEPAFLADQDEVTVFATRVSVHADPRMRAFELLFDDI